MERKRKLKLWVRITLLSVLIMCFIISVSSIMFTILSNKENNSIPIYLYKIDKSVDTKVNLYDNSFINQNNIEQNDMYISELVKDIDVNFSYIYSGSDITNLKYSYEIIGDIKANYSSSDNSTKEIWNKKITYKEVKNKELIQQNRFTISEDININYSELKKEIENFKRQFNMNVSVNMDIYMNVNITGIYNGLEINDTNKILLKMPFLVQAFSIDKDFEPTTSGELLNNLGLINEFNIQTLLTPISILIITLISFVILYKPIFNIKKKNKYNSKLDRILRTYGDVIAEVEKRIGEKGYEVIRVKSINDLISIQSELRLPITFYEIRPNYLCEFIIIHNNIMYKYYLKND